MTVNSLKNDYFCCIFINVCFFCFVFCFCFPTNKQDLPINCDRSIKLIILLATIKQNSIYYDRKTKQKQKYYYCLYHSNSRHKPIYCSSHNRRANFKNYFKIYEPLNSIQKLKKKKQKNMGCSFPFYENLCM